MRNNGNSRGRGTTMINSAMNSPFGSASNPSVGVLVGLLSVMSVMFTVLIMGFSLLWCFLGAGTVLWTMVDLGTSLFDLQLIAFVVSALHVRRTFWECDLNRILCLSFPRSHQCSLLVPRRMGSQRQSRGNLWPFLQRLPLLINLLYPGQHRRLAGVPVCDPLGGPVRTGYIG